MLTTVIAAFDDLQLTDLVRSWVVLSEKCPVAVSCSVVPLAIDESGGVISIEVHVLDESLHDWFGDSYNAVL